MTIKLGQFKFLQFKFLNKCLTGHISESKIYLLKIKNALVTLLITYQRFIFAKIQTIV